MGGDRTAYLGKHYGVPACDALSLIRRLGKDAFFDITYHTRRELYEVLSSGSALLGEFDLEEKNSSVKHDEWFIYPQTYTRPELVARFMPARWHRVALLAANSTLLMDPNMKEKWSYISEKFYRTAVGIVGCSVGSGIAHAVSRNLRPMRMKIADPKTYHITNANRVAVNFYELGYNKAVVTASQLHAIDPYVEIDIYNEGITENNVDEFLDGLNVLVDECDNIFMKVVLRERARERGLPVVMVTDLGSAVQLDVRRFDLDRGATLASCASSDAELYNARDACKANPTRENFYAFLRALVGQNESRIPEFQAILNGTSERLFNSVPQLGSTVAAAAGIAAEAVSRIVLGHEVPERMFMHLSNLGASTEWRAK